MQTLTTEQLLKLSHNWTSHQWKNEISALTAHQISTILHLLTPEHNKAHWQANLLAAIEGLSDLHQLEAAAQAFTLPQIKEILHQASQDTALNAKLPPLFVGLPHAVFAALLKETPQEQLLQLKQEGSTEAIQHHLTILAIEEANILATFQSDLFTKEQELKKLPLAEIGKTEIEQISHQITQLFERGLQILAETSKALALAWNTNRMDLIEQFSRIKESCQKNLAHNIGSPLAPDSEHAGLWSIFEQHLNSVFTEETLDGTIAPLPDNLPVSEALVKFGVWYLKDYWQVGLLPEFNSEQQLEPDSMLEGEALQNFRETLFEKVQHNLNQVGLQTLGDLKSKRIYSKKALKAYIEQNT